MRSVRDTVQPQIGQINVNGRTLDVSVRVSFDGVEFVGRIWFADPDPSVPGIPDRGIVPGRSKDQVIAHAKRLGEEELVARYRRALSNRRRYVALRSATDEILRKVRYLNQVAISMRAGLIDLDGAAQEIDITEQQLHDLVRRLRTTAGVEDGPA